MKRPLSVPEIFIWAGGQIPRNFALTAHIQGHISPPQVQAALAKVRLKDPEIAGRVVMIGGTPWYETDSVADPSIRCTQGDWANEVATELMTPFSTFSGPLVRLVMIQASDYTDLLIVCHHCIADGLSAAYLLRDLLQYLAYPDSPIIPRAVLPPFEDLLPTPNPTGTPVRITMPQPTADTSMSPRDIDPIYVLPWSLTPDQTARFIARCRQESTSVHAALCTAFLLAFARLEGKQPGLHTVSSPSNIRNRLRQPVSEQFGLYFHPGIKISLDCRGGSDFWTLARGAKTSLDREANAEGFWSVFYLGQQMLQTMPLEQAIRFSELLVDYDLSITNLGQLDIPTINGALCLESIYGPSVNGMAGEKILGVATVAGRMTFTFVSHHRLMAFPLAQQLKDSAMQQLADATGWVA